MKKMYVFYILLAIFLSGCGRGRYQGWQYVRIEYEVPSEKCEYKIQEACSGGGAHCFNWFRQKATLYGANTVVITDRTDGFVSKGRAVVYQGSGGAKTRATSTMTGLADYYYCPPKNNKKDAEPAGQLDRVNGGGADAASQGGAVKLP
jgi:hypothetical protein